MAETIGIFSIFLAITILIAWIQLLIHVFIDDGLLMTAATIFIPFFPFYIYYRDWHELKWNFALVVGGSFLLGLSV